MGQEGNEESGEEKGEGAEEADWECQGGEEADKIWNEDGGPGGGGGPGSVKGVQWYGEVKEGDKEE